MAATAAKLGVNFASCTNSGTTQEWAQCIDTGITRHPSVLDLFGVEATAVEPQIAAAEKAGIKVVVSDSIDTTQSYPADLGLAAVWKGSYSLAGRIIAAQAAVANGGNVSALVLYPQDTVSARAEIAGIKSEWLAVCPKTCTASYMNIPITDWASTTQPTVAAAIASNPNLNVVMPVFDSESEYVIPAFLTANTGKRIQIYTYNGTPAILKLMQEGKPIATDLGQNLSAVAAAILDNDMRVAAHLSPAKSLPTGLFIFTPHNVSTAGTPPVTGQGYGHAYASGFANLWGVKGTI